MIISINVNRLQKIICRHAKMIRIRNTYTLTRTVKNLQNNSKHSIPIFDI